MATSLTNNRVGSLLLWAVFFSTSCGAMREPSAPPTAVSFADRPKNIILLIGDGMALSQVTAGIYWKGGLSKSIFGRFRHVGFHKSISADNLVTDSAAGATAFACGKKTYNGAIGILNNHLPCSSIFEQSRNEGRATGLVVTCTATHATPAAFFAHESMRAFTEQIAYDYVKNPPDCFIGGGSWYFSKNRPDGLNLIDTLRNRGVVVRYGTSFRRLPLDGSKPFMQFTNEREPASALAGRKYLPEATRLSSDYLSKRSTNGFLLMVEGSQIDWALHANDPKWLRAEMLDFEQAVKEALAFADQNGETLVIVTGDHECGGLGVLESSNHRQIKPVFSARLHTAALVPVFAYGAGAQEYVGVYDNTALYDKIKRVKTR